MPTLRASNENNPQLIKFDTLPFQAMEGWEPQPKYGQLFEESSVHKAIMAANMASAKVLSHSVGQAWAYLRQAKGR